MLTQKMGENQLGRGFGEPVDLIAWRIRRVDLGMGEQPPKWKGCLTIGLMVCCFQ